MIAIYNLEPKYFNLALEKVKKYYLDSGERVEDYMQIKHEQYEKIYASSMFKFTDKQYITSDMMVGGTGIDIKAKLPDKIEKVKVYKNIGFTTRGCIRNCEFCVVPEKEGKLIAYGDIYDFWDGKNKEIELLDNNILGIPSHAEKIFGQIKKEKLKLKENGLDIRLLNNHNVEWLKSIRHYDYKFAWDGDIDLTEKLQFAYDNLGQCRIYVLCGILGLDVILLKLLRIKEIGHNAYIMRLDNVRKNKTYISLARWVNQAHLFKKLTWEQFKEKEPKI